MARRGYNLILALLPDEETETVTDGCRFMDVECMSYEIDLTYKESTKENQA